MSNKSKISIETTSSKNISQMKSQNPQKTGDYLQDQANPKRKKLRLLYQVEVLQKEGSGSSFNRLHRRKISPNLNVQTLSETK
jgi:hypothetical protein